MVGAVGTVGIVVVGGVGGAVVVFGRVVVAVGEEEETEIPVAGVVADEIRMAAVQNFGERTELERPTEVARQLH